MIMKLIRDDRGLDVKTVIGIVASIAIMGIILAFADYVIGKAKKGADTIIKEGIKASKKALK